MVGTQDAGANEAYGTGEETIAASANSTALTIRLDYSPVMIRSRAFDYPRLTIDVG